MSSPSSPTCSTCRTPLILGRTGPHCPTCVLQAALSLDTEREDSMDGGSFPRPFGGYQLLEEIGRGGMGLVFKARQVSLERTVALKILLTGPFADEVTRARFRLEAEAAASLQHPNIVSIHEVGEVDGQPYLTMEWVDGPNLAQHCQGKPLPAREAAVLLRDVAAAVQHAHAHGVLHRDLKPANILLGRDGRPRVTDFGMVKRRGTDGGLTVTGQMIGSPNYASPEQAAGRLDEVSVATDVYGLGALLYHLVTGKAPFLAATPADTLRLVLDESPTSPRVVNPRMPRDLETVCLKCLEKNPARRYAGAGELQQELERFLSGLPVHARPISRVESAARWCRRRPAIAALAALAVVLLVGTLVVTSVAARRIARAHSQERVARLAAEQSLYASDMQVISGGLVAAEGASPRDNRERLNRWYPKPGSTRDLRGFEWRYHWTSNQGNATARLRGHAHVVNATRFSPDGTRIATLSVDGKLRLWSAARFESLLEVNEVAVLGGFSPEGQSLIVSRRDGTLSRIEVATGKDDRSPGPGGKLISLHPDGEHLVVYGSDERPRIQALRPDAPRAAARADPPPDTVAALSGDGTRAAVTGRAHPGIVVIDLASQRPIATLIDPRPVIALALSPDGRRLVSAGFDSVLKVWDVDGGRLLHRFRAFLDPVWGLSFSPDGRVFAAGGHNRAIKLWNTGDWTPQATLTGHESTIVHLAFSPDGRRLVSGAEDEQALLWDLAQSRPPDELRRALRGPEWIDRVPGLAFSPDSRFIAGTASDRTVRIWSSDTLEVMASFPGDARTVAFSSDGKTLLSEGYDGVVERWKVSLGPAQTPERGYAPESTIKHWHLDPLTPQERAAVVAGQWAVHATCELCPIPSFRDAVIAGVPTTVSTLTVSADGRTLFLGLPHGGVEVWSVASQTRLRSFQAHKVPISAMAVSPDGRTLATGGLDNTSALWDVGTGRELARFFQHNRPVWALAFSSDGATLAAGSCDKAIKLYNVAQRSCVASLPLYAGTPEGYEQEVRLLRFAPDGNLLVAALGDGSIRFFRALPFSVTDAAENRPDL
jgi:eukaryotic-like serine/threonine-protein kinase